MRTSRITYDPALDGIRALAVIAVVLYHADLSWASGGFLGVDLFFVVSGYLITTLLVREYDATGGLDLVDFWARRVRRLLPALVALVGVVIVVSRWVETESAGLNGTRADAAATLLYVANWWNIAEQTSYFALFVEPSPLLHTWSLAIEEQWYLVWPLVLWLWARSRVRAATAAVACGCVALASVAIMALVADVDDPSRAFFGTDSRGQSLLVGATLAFWMVRDPRRTEPSVRRSVGLVGLVGFVVMAVAVRDTDFWMYRGGFFIAAALSAMLIWGVRGWPDSSLATVLSLRPLPAIGRMSYGIYLWHWPIFVWLDIERTGLEGASLLLMRLAVTGVVAAVSFWVIENPIRKAANSRTVPLLLVAAAGLVAVVALMVIPSVKTGAAGDATRIAAASRADRSVSTAIEETVAMPAPAIADGAELLDEAVQAVGDTDVEPGDGESVAPLRAHFLGDSIYLDLALGYDEPRHLERMIVSADVIIGCGTLRDATYDYCSDRVESWAASIIEESPDVIVIGVSSWDAADTIVGESVAPFGSPRYEANARASWHQNFETMSASGLPIVVVSLPCLTYLPDLQPTVGVRANPERTAAVNALTQSIVESWTYDVHWVDIRELTCPTGEYQDELDGVALHRDGVHFTDEAIPLVWDWLVGEIEAAVR